MSLTSLIRRRRTRVVPFPPPGWVVTFCQHPNRRIIGAWPDCHWICAECAPDEQRLLSCTDLRGGR